ncbi:1,4-alpha-glucan branching protein GlgB [Clostridium sp. AL.422]|uniref:1,4-alpha-glucan branching protein GlgB n=1 Tax=Clostridium TaxID=1485 RepID=UPI00293DCA1F|nr:MULTISPECIES: 1,4-alpha-glucan branching protein GlgB [unclassified Clostridium]MDV4152625.1 1,4-alpha-glucan branching protein GlgB [Clostridium sp. AL.422]
MPKVVKDNLKDGIFIEKDIELFHMGKNNKSYSFMGAHCISENRRKGVRFTTWAPNAEEVYVVGDFCEFKPIDEHKMEKVNSRGLWSLFIPGIKEEMKYKYYIINKYSKEGKYKADPYAKYSELRPNTASIVKADLNFRWSDKKWLNKRDKMKILEEPINIYEMHLGSWKRKGGEFMTYKELCNELPRYLIEMGYTHVEFMPLSEHPLDASWGYQSTGYFSVTSRYGNAKELKELINTLHKNDIGVILDWVPGHFCKDEHGLYMFDGSPTYEYEEGWKAENKGWGTANFDLGRPEVKSFLISNAFFWLKEFHIDGLRVDAVSNIIYLNYGRKEGEWKANKFGGNGCLEGIEFLRELNSSIYKEFSNVLIIAEESSAWPKVSKSIEEGGLGFNFKWNMGWMNDTLKYIQLDPVYRKNNHNKMTFSMMYNYSENFILPISHDEIVHGKKSLVDKMWGDYWNKFAGLRLYLAYMMGHPGKKLTFMGYELAQFIEWREYEELEWKLIDNFDMHKNTQTFIKELNKLYKLNKALWELDYDTTGFEWIDANNSEQSIFSFIRRGRNIEDTLIFICNFTPVVYHGFRVGVPYKALYEEIFNTDNYRFGGSNQLNESIISSENIGFHNKDHSISIKIPPMGASVFKVSNVQ